tara:strand:- start:224 stop:526 length:303 start_codon:yes stop_codon:yes gene_type:complete
MCFGSSQATPAPQRTFDDSPPVVTGSQTGVENPKDTKKVTERLEQDRRESEGFFNPGDSLKIPTVTGKGGKGGVVKRNQRSARLRSKTKTKSFSNRAKGV